MYRLSARQIHKNFCEKKITAVEIAEYFLKRIETHDQKVGAFLTIFRQEALEKAKLLDQKLAEGKKLGPLAAVPIGIKDNIHIKEQLTTCGSKFLVNYRAPFDATVTRLLEEADALILGKINLDEFAMGSSTENSALQETSNPWNLDCVPGGSSGGSAAACAARLVPITLGSDTGGSVRQPAAFCGVVGLKPTYGRVSRYGLVAFGSSLDQIGPLATTTEDIAMVMEVLGAHDPHDATSLAIDNDDYLANIADSVQGKRVGVPWHFLESLPEEAKKHFMNSIDVLKGLGCEIVEVNLDSLKHAVATYYIIATAEASTNLARFDGIRYGVRSAEAQTLEEVYIKSRSEGFGPEVKKRILLGTYVLSAGYQDAFHKRACKVRVKITDEFQKAFAQCDLISTPVSPIAAFPKGAIADPLEMYLQDIYTIGINLAHLSAISVPCGFNSEQKPFGLQLIGPKKADPLVCRMAYAYEKQTGFANKIPPEFDRE